MDINRPNVVAEVSAAFGRYEAALERNDTGDLSEIFWHSDLTIRYGMDGEIGHGWAEIQGHRLTRKPNVRPWRQLEQTVITTFGQDMATASTLFTWADDPKTIGRQMQTWARLDGAWRIVAAHVSRVPKRDGD